MCYFYIISMCIINNGLSLAASICFYESGYKWLRGAGQHVVTLAKRWSVECCTIVNERYVLLCVFGCMYISVLIFVMRLFTCCSSALVLFLNLFLIMFTANSM